MITWLPVLRQDLYLFDQSVALLLFVSCILLLLVWPLSGPLVAAILSALSLLFSLYLLLSAKEPSFFLQAMVYAGLFFATAYSLYQIQRGTKNLALTREKLTEGIHLAQRDVQKKEILKRALQKKIDTFLDLQRFSGDLKEAMGLEGVGARIVREAYQVLGRADECVLYRVDETRQELVFLTGMGRKGEATAVPGGSPFEQWVMKRGQALMVQDTLNDFRFTAEAKAGLETLRSVCASPLVTENKVLGVVRASSAKPRMFSADDLRLMDMFASFGAVSLRNVLLYDTMDELAMRDSLTGLYLNRYFQERLSEELAKAKLSEEPLSLVLLDIDFFKEFNDEYGHLSGDQVLRMTASLILKCIRPRDIAARYGGEEFVVLLPQKEKKAALGTAEKIRAEMERNVFRSRRAERRVTMSLGVASFPDDGSEKEEILLAADKCLYQAKKMGRNKVCG